MHATQSMAIAAANGAGHATRESGGVSLAGFHIQLRWPCADGHVSVTFLFGSALGLATRRLMEVVHDDGYCDEATRDKDWLAYGELILSGQEARR